jgi:hypothetical protein
VRRRRPFSEIARCANEPNRPMQDTKPRNNRKISGVSRNESETLRAWLGSAHGPLYPGPERLGVQALYYLLTTFSALHRSAAERLY